MISIFKRYPLTSALCVVAALLLAVLAAELGAGAALRERLAGLGSSKPAVVQTRLLPPVAVVNPDVEYPETAARPLFTPTRRPAPPATQAAAAPAMNKGQFTLTGVTIVGDTKIALLREKSSGRVVRVEQGKDVNGITVAKIEPDKVTLTQSGDEEVVAMLVSKGAPQPPVPFASAAGPFAPQPTGQPTAQPPGFTPGVNPTARAAPPGVPVAAPPPPQTPPVNPNTLFGPRPGSALDPTTATPTDGAPLTPEELLARRRARRNQQSQ
jgi:general secretion pathway protein N